MAITVHCNWVFSRAAAACNLASGMSNLEESPPVAAKDRTERSRTSSLRCSGRKGSAAFTGDWMQWGGVGMAWLLLRGDLVDLPA